MRVIWILQEDIMEAFWKKGKEVLAGRMGLMVDAERDQVVRLMTSGVRCLRL